jgi:hypothetical protein
MDVWGRGYFEKRVPDRAAFEACASYIHRNPVKAGMIEDEEAYAFSSATRKEMVDSMPDWFGESLG